MDALANATRSRATETTTWTRSSARARRRSDASTSSASSDAARATVRASGGDAATDRPRDRATDPAAPSHSSTRATTRMVHLQRPSTIHEDYLAARGLRRAPSGALKTLCVVSGVSAALYLYARRASTNSAATASTATRTTNRGQKHMDTWRSTWDKGAPRQHVNNLQYDPAARSESTGH